MFDNLVKSPKRTFYEVIIFTEVKIRSFLKMNGKPCEKSHVSKGLAQFSFVSLT
jgi:hypothetical protein